ncbi:hypothetical protein [uncultured Clostridium sp.]|uniref:hypothetical protein n=1 Tax=uncultured Clostridium sp. TaxID=59620 RepID=UPI003218069C
MKLITQNTCDRPNYKYSIYTETQLIYRVEATKGTFASLCKIIVYDKYGIELYNVAQKNFNKIILRLIPFMSFFKFSVCPFEVYKDDICVGSIHEKSNGGCNIIADINGINYEIIEQTEKYVHIFKENEQVGLIERINSSINNAYDYIILLNKNIPSEIVTIFSIIVDLTWNYGCRRNDINFYNGIKTNYHEKRWNLQGKNLNKNWTPKEE